MARPNQLSCIPTNVFNAGCSIASRYNDGEPNESAISNVSPYNLIAPSNFIALNSQWDLRASVSGHFLESENDWNETGNDPLHQAYGQESRLLPMFIPASSHFPNERTPEHTVDLIIGQGHPLWSRAMATKVFGEPDTEQDGNFVNGTGKKITACMNLAIGILSSWVYLKPNCRPSNLKNLYQEAFKALHSTTCSNLFAKWAEEVGGRYQEVAFHELEVGLFSFFYEHHGDNHALHLEKLHQSLKRMEIDNTDFQRLTWSIFVRRLETEPDWILDALSRGEKHLFPDLDFDPSLW